MARPRKNPLEQGIEIPTPPAIVFDDFADEVVNEKPQESKKVLCKAFHMVVGVDLIGSKTSLSTSKNMELEVTPLGIKAYSKASKRSVLIPWTNIKGAELFI